VFDFPFSKWNNNNIYNNLFGIGWIFKFTTIWYHNIMHGCAILIFGQLPFDNFTTNVLLFSWWALKNKLVNDILVS
jgi:hypothetical protein